MSYYWSYVVARVGGSLLIFAVNYEFFGAGTVVALVGGE
jgi:hypothetical protein